jgi:hypothetical protein
MAVTTIAWQVSTGKVILLLPTSQILILKGSGAFETELLWGFGNKEQ